MKTHMETIQVFFPQNKNSVFPGVGSLPYRYRRSF